MSRTVRIGVDVGGTFTDLLLHDPRRGLIRPGKLPTTPHAPNEAITAGTARLLEETSTAPGDVADIVHGTTLVTNTLLERTGADSTYRAVFGRSLDGAVEVVNWRLSMQLPRHELSTEGGHARGGEASRGVRSVYFPGHGLLEATVWNRYELTPGTELAGPAIFEERESSCSFGPDCRIRVTDDLTLVAEVDRA